MILFMVEIQTTNIRQNLVNMKVNIITLNVQKLVLMVGQLRKFMTT